MLSLEQISQLADPTPSKIVLLVLDGLGGLPRPETGLTELETARTPNLDRLAREGICGMAEPVGVGITPGSAPGHLALFGYDPERFSVGRGALAALGVDLALEKGDLAARGNFCTLDDSGVITDRRAGRIATEKCVELCQLLDGMSIDGTGVLVSPVKEHRFVAVFRGENLSSELGDSDPQHGGVPPKAVIPRTTQAARAAYIANEFIARARETLAGHYPTNMVLLRGFAHCPDFPTMTEVFKLRPAAIASYPMYRGLAKVVGMDTLPTGPTIADALMALAQHYDSYDFFFVHVKETDMAGEDGDFDRKVRVIEDVDAVLPALIGLKPDVIVVASDHSTPALLKGHSWHPVPFLLHSKWCRPDAVEKFGESACATGGLGRFPAVEIMPLALANAGKLGKFGA
jgi:2,3-bisphosphoglycerate-independent phosphoglycerate mutase